MRARRWWAWLLVPVYAAALAVKDGLRRVGVLRTRRLAWPVVSVGSLSAGGAGKTPVVIALAELLRERGWGVDVLSRGYGREGSGVERVDVDAADAARRFGDEPVLIARRTEVPVWVGAERFAAGVAAETSASAADNIRGVHLLDDGFQHRQLARAMDVVVVTAEDLEDAFLPAGNRREGLGALRRADAVVVREKERASVLPRLTGRMKVGAAVWIVRRTIELSKVPDALHCDIGLIAFCAIARPRSFTESLHKVGAKVIDVIAFSDHHIYTREDMLRLTKACKARGCGGFITTEKDAVKISEEMRAQLEEIGPLLIARLQSSFVDEESVVRELEARIS